MLETTNQHQIPALQEHRDFAWNEPEKWPKAISRVLTTIKDISVTLTNEILFQLTPSP